MRRTSVRAFFASFVFLAIGIFFISLAGPFYYSTNPIRFSGGGGRPWNHWDYAGIASFVIAASLVVVGLMFLDKDE